MTGLLTRADVEDARHAIAPHLPPTPLRARLLRARRPGLAQARMLAAHGLVQGARRPQRAHRAHARRARARRGGRFRRQPRAGRRLRHPDPGRRHARHRLRPHDRAAGQGGQAAHVPGHRVEGGATYDEAAARAAEHARPHGRHAASTPTTIRAPPPARARSPSRSSSRIPGSAPSWCRWAAAASSRGWRRR